jgi:hypothetical protein
MIRPSDGKRTWVDAGSPVRAYWPKGREELAESSIVVCMAE